MKETGGTVLSRRSWVYLAIGAIVLGSGYLVFGSSEERKVLEIVREMAAAVGSLPGDTPASRHRRVAAALRKRATDGLVVIVTPELEPLEGRAAVTEVVASLSGVELEISVEDSTVRFGSDGRARAALVAGVSAKLPGLVRRERRNVQIVLEPEGDDYRMTRVEVGPPSREEPEARP